MSLPIHLLPIVERWDCHQCGFCCHGSIVPLSERDLERLRDQQWDQRPEFRGRRTVEPLPGKPGRMKLAQHADGRCVFLLPDGLCRIHSELGFDAKPLICRMFPLQLIPHEKQAVLTMRRACPSAAADKGRPLSEYLDAARAYAQEGGLVDEGGTAPPCKPGEAADWRRARVLLEALRRITSDARYPPIRRLVHGVEFCRMWETADTREFSTAKLAELAGVLEEHLADEAAPYFAERSPAPRGARVLFRQLAIEVARLHPRARHAPRWSDRWRHLAWAWRMAWGGGKLPRIHPHFSPATFAQLEAPLRGLTPAMVAAFDNYFTAATASYVYALANRRGWSIVESYRHLALLYPVGLYLLRWVSAGRTATDDDLYEIVCALDRAQGYQPLTGGAQRRRIYAIARLEAIPKLVAWYGR